VHPPGEEVVVVLTGEVVDVVRVVAGLLVVVGLEPPPEEPPPGELPPHEKSAGPRTVQSVSKAVA
jgi:hypothetical protein